MPANTAIQRLSMASAEVRNVAVSFVDVLDEGEVLTGTPTIAQVSPSTSVAELTFANQAINSSTTRLVNGKTVPLNQAVQFKVTAPTVTSKTEFQISIVIATTSTPAQSLKKYILLDVDVE